MGHNITEHATIFCPSMACRKQTDIFDIFVFNIQSTLANGNNNQWLSNPSESFMID
jgi:hypothetical protein